MSKITSELSVPEAARKTDRKARTARVEPAASYAEVDQFTRYAKERISLAIDEAIMSVFRKLVTAGSDQESALYCSNDVYTIVAVAVEAAAAKAAGYETWAAFETAQAARRIDVAA